MLLVGQLAKLRAGCLPALLAGCRGTLWVRRRLPACPTFDRGVPEQFLQQSALRVSVTFVVAKPFAVFHAPEFAASARPPFHFVQVVVHSVMLPRSEEHTSEL